MGSYGLGFAESLGLTIWFLTALVLVIWGFQQRQTYETRQDGRLKLTIGTSLMGAFLLAVVVSMVVVRLSDSGDQDSAAPAAGSSEADVALDGAKRYLRAIDQVRVTGTSSGVHVDLTFVEDSDAVGILTTGGVKIRVLHLDGQTYIKPADSFWKANNNAGPIIRFINGRWIRMDSKDERFAKLTSFANRDLFRAPLDEVRDYTVGAPQTIGGVECIAVKPSFGGVLYLTQNPARLVRMEDGAGFVADLDYDAPTVALKAPSRVVDGSDVFS